jgi:hypothetical protein
MLDFKDFDLARAEGHRSGASIAPRTDVPDSERYYVVLDHRNTPRGFLQKYQNGSAGYWFQPMEQAKLADTWEVAFHRVLDLHPGGVSATLSIAQEQSRQPRFKG